MPVKNNEKIASVIVVFIVCVIFAYFAYWIAAFLGISLITNWIDRVVGWISLALALVYGIAYVLGIVFLICLLMYCFWKKLLYALLFGAILLVMVGVLQTANQKYGVNFTEKIFYTYYSITNKERYNRIEHLKVRLGLSTEEFKQCLTDKQFLMEMLIRRDRIDTQELASTYLSNIHKMEPIGIDLTSSVLMSKEKMKEYRYSVNNHDSREEGKFYHHSGKVSFSSAADSSDHEATVYMFGDNVLSGDPVLLTGEQVEFLDRFCLYSLLCDGVVYFKVGPDRFYRKWNKGTNGDYKALTLQVIGFKFHTVTSDQLFDKLAQKRETETK